MQVTAGRKACYYAAVLGPVAGIMICDYYLVRRKQLVVNDLYWRGGEYEYSNGFN